MKSYVKHKVLVIHCGTLYLDQLINHLEKTGVTVRELDFDGITRKLQRGIDLGHRVKIELDICNEKIGSYDAVIYAGGVIRESVVPGIYQKIKRWSIQFIRDLEVPYFGICLGHMMLGFAYRATYRLMRKRIKNPIKKETGIRRITFHREFPLAQGIISLEVYEDHERELFRLPDCLINSATSQDSEIQAIYHVNKRQYSVQFHPEVDGTEGYIILDNFLKSI